MYAHKVSLELGSRWRSVVAATRLRPPPRRDAKSTSEYSSPVPRRRRATASRLDSGRNRNAPPRFDTYSTHLPRVSLSLFWTPGETYRATVRNRGLLTATTTLLRPRSSRVTHSERTHRRRALDYVITQTAHRLIYRRKREEEKTVARSRDDDPDGSRSRRMRDSR